MGFSREWDDVYKNGKQLSVWPWTDLVSLVNRYVILKPGDKILELGCGAGANIPFLSSVEGTYYYAVDGSSHIVSELNKKYSDRDNIVIECADFTEQIPFNEEFNLIVDRSAITHNTEDDIRNVLDLVNKKMTRGGVFIGMDWHSTCYSFFQEGTDEFDEIDKRTRIYKTGDFAGSGVTHFSDESHLRDLLKNFRIRILYEKQYKYYEPYAEMRGGWDFVAFKGD